MDTIEIFKDFLLPLFVCVVLPVMIVFLVQFYRSRNLARKAEIIKAAIEKGVQIDAATMNELFRDNAMLDSRPVRKKTVARTLLDKLTKGIIMFLVGLSIILIVALTDTFAGDGSAFLYIIGAIFSVIGIGFIVFFVVGRKMLPEDEDR